METLQLIVECIEGDEREQIINRIAKVKYRLPMINSYVIELPKNRLNELKGIQGIKSVYQNTHITAQMDNARAQLKVDDAQIKSIHHDDLTVAILDTGVSPVDDLVKPINRIIKFKDFINGKETPYDDNGHGTHVTGIVGGNGYSSKGRYKGIAPKIKLVCIKILDENGKGNSSDVLAGVQWVLDNRKRYNIKVMNLSVGTMDVGQNDPLVKAVEKAWDLGIVTVIAAGNNGPNFGTVTSPGISRKVITVGSSEDKGAIWVLGETIENFSGCGPTSECIVKPDVIAPGNDIISCLTKSLPDFKQRDKNIKIIDKNYMQMSGTSMSTPMVSGAVALLIAKYPNLKPNDVKLKLKRCAVNLNYPQNRQGWGLVDVQKLLE